MQPRPQPEQQQQLQAAAAPPAYAVVDKSKKKKKKAEAEDPYAEVEDPKKVGKRSQALRFSFETEQRLYFVVGSSGFPL